MSSDSILREALGGLRRDAKRSYRTKDPALLISIGMGPGDDESMPDDMDEEDDDEGTE